MPQSCNITVTAAGESAACRNSSAVGGGRPQPTLSVVRNNVDMYQEPRPTSQACRTFGKILHHGTSFLVGGGITAGTTYALVKHVQSAIANASVSSDPNTWINKANVTYQNCYNGCNDCDDTSFAYNACATTAGIKANGTLCDGNAMWNWLARYPMPCLEALGGTLRNQALSAARQDKRDQLSLIILTVLAGAVGWVATYKLIGCVASRMGAGASNRQPSREGIQT